MKRTPMQKARIAIVLSLLLLAPFIARWAGLTSQLSVEHLRQVVADAGAWGAAAFVGIFVLTMLVQVPGIAFVMVAPTLFRLPEALALCLLASNVSVLLNFAVVRRFGGQPLADIESPRLRRLFAQLESHPVRTVALLRTITVMFPPVTSALALTQVSARDHALGSVLGMLLPVSALVLVAAALVDVVP